MKGYKLLSFCLALFLLFVEIFAAKEPLILKSPDQNITVTISVDDNLTWSLLYKNTPLLRDSPLSLKLSDGTEPGKNVQVQKTNTASANEIISAVVAVKSKKVLNQYNEVTLSCKGNYQVVFRAYNDGAAYRFVLNLPQKEVEVLSETAVFNFADNFRTLFPEEEAADFLSHYERTYKDTLVGTIAGKRFCSLPVLLEEKTGIKMVITDADLFNYPNMFLEGTGGNALRAIYPKVILEKEPVGDRDDEIKKIAPYIAKISGKSSLPWRTIIVAEHDKDLLGNDLVYKLSRSADNQDFSWVKPGKVAWDWWNALNVYGVDFRSGINTATYKYYVDFASKYKLDYIILDEGWSKTTHDLLNPTPELNPEELFAYAKEKNVGIILWVLWNALDKNMDQILDKFVSWGAKGIKVDFMQRADQDMVNYYEKVAAKAAERKLLVDFHGAYKPSGLNRKYPNVLSFEGVKGLENSKWSTEVTPKHDVTLPFIRMAAGPMDYTPGAMLNAGRDNFRPVFSEPMSQGTRAHQAAMYVVYESPLQMLCDNPSNYLKEPDYTVFIASIPTTWDETIGLTSKVGEYVVVARRAGSGESAAWYVAAMTNWEPRELEIPLTFLGRGEYKSSTIEDGINADRHGSDYRIRGSIVHKNETLKIKLAPGGGWVGKIYPVEHLHYIDDKK